MASALALKPLQYELYHVQNKAYWPVKGRHILAQYDDDSIIVYQAFNPNIAEYAVKHQRFGGDSFSFARMSWIKPNFLWMMYRCGWATKKNQEHVLAIRITRDGFETILKNAYTANAQKAKGLTKDDIEVRLQWDPDHSPSYEKLERKAIQLGLKGKMLQRYSEEFVISIEDITDFVVKQRENVTKEKIEHLLTASERIYQVSSEIQEQVEMNLCD